LQQQSWQLRRSSQHSAVLSQQGNHGQLHFKPPAQNLNSPKGLQDEVQDVGKQTFPAERSQTSGEYSQPHQRNCASEVELRVHFNPCFLLIRPQ
jgi:hypothetical protein